METVEIKRRVLIEGGFSDDFANINSVHPTELVLGDDVSRINIRHLGSSLLQRLVLVYNFADGKLIPTNPTQEKDVEQSIIDYDVIPIISAMVVDDGRVFLNISNDEHSEEIRERIRKFVERIKNVTGETNFVELFFTQKGRQRFNHLPVVVYNAPK